MHIFVVKKSTIIRAAVFLLLIVGAIVYTQVAMGDATPAASMSDSMPICRVAAEDKVVALTVDTAFGDADYTDVILKTLNEESVHATFFVMGLWAGEHPEALDAIAQDGQEIASHSMNHMRYTEMTADEILADAKDAAQLIFDATGYDTRIIRIPYGAFDTASITALESEGYVPVKWSLDSKDWKGLDAQTVANDVLANVQSGDILMFQNNMAATPEALRDVILGLREQGFEIKTVSDLLLDGDYIVDATGTQKYFED